jgi:DNA-binding transcriptional LysR family regulator
VPNLVEDGFDVSLMCAWQLTDSGYVASTLGTTHLVLIASPAYLARNGVPTVPADLASHVSLRFLSPVAPANEWHLESAGDSVVVPLDASPFQVNTPDALAQALRSGVGIGALAIYNAIDDLRSGALVRVLPQYRLRAFNVYAMHAPGRYPDAKVRKLIDYLRMTIPDGLAAIQRDLDDMTAAQAQTSSKPGAPTPMLRVV